MSAHALITRFEHALLEQAQEIAARAQSRIYANRGPNRPSRSKLAESIQVSEEADGITIRATAPYAVAVEFGTFHRLAEPFLGPSVAEARAGLASRMAAHMGEAG